MALAIVTPVKAAQQQYVPIQEDIEITKNIKDIQTAGYYSAALMRNGDLWTWGSMAKGESYSSSKVSQDTEQKSAVFMIDVKEFVLGTNCYAAIKNDGSLYAWGDNSFGAIGIGKAPNIDYSENSNDYAEPVPVKVVDNVKDVTHDSVNRMMYLKNNGSLWAAGSGKYGVLSELDEENSTQYNFYRNPILITLKGKSPSLTVKDGNNSGTTDPEEPDSGDIDDGDYGHDQGNKDNAGDKQQDQVGGQIKPSTPATKKPSTITTIAVSGTNILKIQNVKGKKVKIRWKKNTKVAGYQIQYSMKKNFKSGMKTIYSKWSSVKKVKIKK